MTCPECGSDATTQTTQTDDDGMAEWTCYDCGMYWQDAGEQRRKEKRNDADHNRHQT